MLEQSSSGHGSELAAPGGQLRNARADNRVPCDQTKRFLIFLAVLVACFSLPLYRLCRYALKDEFFSYIPLVPFISLYLIRLKKKELSTCSVRSSKVGILLAILGFAVLAGSVWATYAGWKPELENYLTVMIGSLWLFLMAGAFLFLGADYCRVIRFSLAFLLFMVPMPSVMLDATDTFFQHTSAMAALGFLKVFGMPVFLDNLTLNLPGYSIVVAPECSGLHSTMVLLMTSFLAGHLFLRTGWKRLVLVLFVIPLAIARNGFRIFIICELCVQISHDMIHSYIHRRGGPIFFALSLIPFFYVLFLLRKSEPLAQARVDTGGKL